MHTSPGTTRSTTSRWKQTTTAPDSLRNPNTKDSSLKHSLTASYAHWPGASCRPDPSLPRDWQPSRQSGSTLRSSSTSTSSMPRCVPWLPALCMTHFSMSASARCILTSTLPHPHSTPLVKLAKGSFFSQQLDMRSYQAGNQRESVALLCACPIRSPQNRDTQCTSFFNQWADHRLSVAFTIISFYEDGCYHLIFPPKSSSVSS